MNRRPFPLRIYRALSHVALPAVELIIARRVKRGKEDPNRLAERRGRSAYARPEGILIWVHAASVGEVATALPIVRRMRERGAAVLVTTVTVTSARLAEARLPEGALHQFVPFDLPGAVDRFLNHWQPNLALFMEQELWPNLLAGCRARSIPAVLVNARMSPRSFKRWTLASGVVRHLLGHFSVVLAQSADDADRLLKLGAARTVHVGNIKYDVPMLPVDADLLSRVTQGFIRRPLWTAASTHPGEEEQVLAAHAMVRQISGSRPGLILAPRHPERGDDVAQLCRERGLSIARWSQGELPSPSTDVFLLDTIGDLGIAYSASNLAFIGGSLLPRIGGHNPIEAAKLGRMVMHGPHVHNFAEVFGALDHSGGGIEISDGSSLGSFIVHLMKAADERETRAQSARMTVEGLGGAIDRVLTALDPFFVQTRLDALP